MSWLTDISEILHLVCLQMKMQNWLQFSEFIKSWLVIIGGAIGLGLAWLRVTAANRQSEAALKQAETAILESQLSRRTHVSELFNQAVGQLGDEKLEIRLGAVYTLRDIVSDYPDLTKSVFDLLIIHVRENATKDNDSNKSSVDIEEIIKFLATKMGTKS
jgi:hypothetical protein